MKSWTKGSSHWLLFLVFCSKMLIFNDVILFHSMSEVTVHFACTSNAYHKLLAHEFNFLTTNRMTKCFHLAKLPVNGFYVACFQWWEIKRLYSGVICLAQKEYSPIYKNGRITHLKLVQVPKVDYKWSM